MAKRKGWIHTLPYSVTWKGGEDRFKTKKAAEKAVKIFQNRNKSVGKKVYVNIKLKKLSK